MALQAAEKVESPSSWAKQRI